MKKAQIGQIFIYLVSTLVIILVLYYGYGAIKNIGAKQKELSYVKFQNSLTDLVSRTSSDFGTVRVESLVVPSGFTQVCFVDPGIISPSQPEYIEQNEYPLIYDSVSDGVNADVFVLPGGTPFFIGKMQVDGNFLCLNATQGKIMIRVEGLGDRAKISAP